eukprot:sb/3467774/
MVINIPVSFLVEKVFTVKPKHLYPILYIIKGLFVFAYGCVMYQGQWSGEKRLVLCFIIILTMKLVTSFDGGYMEKHVVPELSKKYNVKLGVMNSTSTFLGLTVDSLKMIAVGQVYSRLTLEDASLYLCSFCLALGVGLSIFFYYAFSDIEAAPIKKKRKGIHVIKNIREQFSTLMGCEVKEIVFCGLAASMTISNGYVSLYLLMLVTKLPLWYHCYLAAPQRGSGPGYSINSRARKLKHVFSCESSELMPGIFQYSQDFNLSSDTLRFILNHLGEGRNLREVKC